MTSSTKTRNTKPVMDFSSLAAPKAAELPKSGNGGMLAGTPFVGWVRESRDNGNKGRETTVPVAAVTQVVYLLRQAAAELGCGIRVVPGPAKNGSVVVKFQAKDKRKHTPATPEQLAERKAKREAAKAAKARAEARKNAPKPGARR